MVLSSATRMRTLRGDDPPRIAPAARFDRADDARRLAGKGRGDAIEQKRLFDGFNQAAAIPVAFNVSPTSGAKRGEQDELRLPRAGSLLIVRGRNRPCRASPYRGSPDRKHRCLGCFVRRCRASSLSAALAWRILQPSIAGSNLAVGGVVIDNQNAHGEASKMCLGGWRRGGVAFPASR